MSVKRSRLLILIIFLISVLGNGYLFTIKNNLIIQDDSNPIITNEEVRGPTRSALMDNIVMDGVINAAEWANAPHVVEFFLDLDNGGAPPNVDGNNYLYIGEDADNLYVGLDMCGDQSGDPTGEWIGVWLNTNETTFNNYAEWEDKLNNGAESLIHDVGNNKSWAPYFLNSSMANGRNEFTDSDYDSIYGSIYGDASDLQNVGDGDHFNITSVLNGTSYVTWTDFEYNVSDFYSAFTDIYLNKTQYLQFRIESKNNVSLTSNKMAFWYNNGTYDLSNPKHTFNLTTGTNFADEYIDFYVENLTENSTVKFSIYGNNSAPFNQSIDIMWIEVYRNETNWPEPSVQHPFVTIDDNYQINWSFAPSSNNASNHRMFEFKIPKSELELYEFAGDLGIIVGGYGTAAMEGLDYWVYSYSQLNSIDEQDSGEYNYYNKSGLLKFSPIDIDGTATGVGAHNWTWARSQVWCQQGNGSWSNPYIIENVFINAQGTGYGIFIKNSNAYFIIRNSILINSSDGAGDAGIYLEYADNGRIYNNNCSLNGNTNAGAGVSLYYSDNNTISNNFFFDNAHGIITIYDNFDNTYYNNTILNSTGYGIYMYGGSVSTNNVIKGNTIKFGQTSGIYSENHNDTIINNTITDTIIAGDAKGIKIDGGTGGGFNLIENNTILRIEEYGIFIYNGANNNTIHGNTIQDINGPGVYIENSNYSIIIGNIIENAGIFDNGSNNVWAMNRINGTHTPLSIDAAGGAWGTFTWEEVETYVPWIGSDGTWADPYIIENLEIDASGSGSGIQIENSKNVYFIIRKCNISNSGGGSNGGIYLLNTENGTLDNNNCSINGGAGIRLENSNNITISNNIVTDNGPSGVYLFNSDDNKIIHNYAAFTGIGSDQNYGIWVSQGCSNNIIINNTANNNEFTGIFIEEDNNWNKIINNTANDNGGEGIRVWDTCTYNIISNNTVSDTGGNVQTVGIILSVNNQNNNVTGNTAKGHTQYGIYISTNSDNNTIAGNTISSSGTSNIRTDAGCDTNIVIGNTITGTDISDSGTNNVWAMNRINGTYTPLSIDANGGAWGTFTWEEVEMYVPWIGSDGSIGDPYVIKDLVIDANGTSYGLYIRDSINFYFTIQNCTIFNTSAGINDAGIRLENSANGTIIGCNISNNGKYGILFINVNDSQIIETNCSNNNVGIWLGSYCNSIKIEGNTVSFAVNDGININRNNDNIEILNNFIYNNTGNGIDWTYDDPGGYNATIVGNIIHDNGGNGFDSGNNWIYYLDFSRNTIYNNERGIDMTNCYNGTIAKNTIYNNNYGIYLRYANPYNMIFGNILDNNNYSIYLENNVNNNTFWDNEITNSLIFGVYITNIISECQNNTFYDNTFNNPLGINALDNCSYNNWYLGTTGNRWHNYNGTDANDDNRGDTPYNITGTAGSQDLYPIFNDGCDVDCEDDGGEEPPDLTGYWILLAILLPFIGVMVALGVFYKYKPEEFKKFVDKMRQKKDIKITRQFSTNKLKKAKPKAAVPTKPKAEVKKPIVKEEPKPVPKKAPKRAPKPAPKKAPKAVPKEISTQTKTLDETELQNKFRAETGKNAIWRGQETKAYTEWKKQSSK
jgi:parallel beta-helix repeat protein